MTHGKIKWFDTKKGYGFVTDDEGKDFFVHFSGITKGRHYTGLDDGDEVTFEISEGKKGPQATNMQLVAQPKKEDRETPANA